MRELNDHEAQQCCCQNDYLNRASGCRSDHTLVSLMRVVSRYRDRVPEAPQIAAGCVLKALDDLTAAGIPDSVSVLPNADEIRRGRRELLDAGIAVHGDCVARAIYHQVERALQQRIAGDDYDPFGYACSAEPRRAAARATVVPIARILETEPAQPAQFGESLVEQIIPALLEAEVVERAVNEQPDKDTTVGDREAISDLVAEGEADTHGEHCDEHCWHRGHEPEEPT